MWKSEVRRTQFLSLLSFCLLAACLFTVGAFNNRGFARQFRAQIAKQLSIAAELKAEQLSQFGRNRLNDAAFFQDNGSFSSLVERFLTVPGDREGAENLGELLAGFRRMARYDRILLVGVDGVVRLSVPEAAEPMAEILRESMAKVIASPQTLLVDFHREGAGETVFLSTLVPVFAGGGRGRLMGILVLRNDPQGFPDPYLERWPSIGESMETCLVRREGDEVVFLNGLRFDPQAALRRRIPIVGHGDMPAVMAVCGRTGFVEGRDERGVPTVADIRAVPDSPWFLVARLDRSEAFRPVYSRVAVTAALFAVLLSAFGAGILIFLRREEARSRGERARSTEALAESERRYRTLFEALMEGVALHQIVRDDDGKAVDYRFVSVNPAFFDHLGKQASAVEGLSATAYYGTDAAPYLDVYESVVRTGKPQVFETYFAPLARHFQISVVSPKPGQFATIFTDITERLLREKELRERNEELARFTYMVSHDLRSPLVTVRTFLGFLEQDLARGDAERRGQDIAYIRTAAEKMNQLLDELLEFSRIGRRTEPPTDAPLAAVVADALSLTAGRIAARGVHVALTEEPVVLHGERGRLVEVFENLIDNAVKFMGDQSAPLVRIGIEPGDPPVLFVADNGAGIDPRHKDKLFGLFEKLDPGTEGSGVGLALVKRIVETHGGNVWALSEGLGRGAEFRFTLPGTRLEKAGEGRP